MVVVAVLAMEATVVEDTGVGDQAMVVMAEVDTEVVAAAAADMVVVAATTTTIITTMETLEVVSLRFKYSEPFLIFYWQLISFSSFVNYLSCAQVTLEVAAAAAATMILEATTASSQITAP